MASSSTPCPRFCCLIIWGVCLFVFSAVLGWNAPAPQATLSSAHPHLPPPPLLLKKIPLSFLQVSHVVGEPTDALTLWGEMVDSVRQRIGASKYVIYNGFFDTGAGHLAGEAALNHTTAVYVESMASVGGPKPRLGTVAERVAFLRWVASGTSASPAYPGPLRQLVGHGNFDASDRRVFVFGFAVHLLVLPRMADAHFLANAGYNIDQGILPQAADPLYSAPLGEPRGPFVVDSASPSRLTRTFANGSVSADLATFQANITVGGVRLA